MDQTESHQQHNNDSEETAEAEDLQALLEGSSTSFQFPTAQIDQDYLAHWSERHRYHINSILGFGAHGTVHGSTQKYLERDVAIKFCRNEDERIRERFRNEACISAELEHPAIIPVYEAGDGYMVMLQLRGKNFSQSIFENTLSLPERIEIVAQSCTAIAYANDLGIIHRDIKASNIMLGTRGEVMVVDWGLASRLEQDRLPPENRFGDPVARAGTPACLAPEVARAERKHIGTASDRFCVGALLYHAICGRMPYFSPSAQESLTKAQNMDYPLIESLNVDAPRELQQLCNRLMNENFALRPPLDSVRESLRRWILLAGNETLAEERADTARTHIARTNVHRRGNIEQTFDNFIAALSEYEAAITLAPQRKDLMEERDEALDLFIRTAIKAGEIALARLLKRGGRVPYNHDNSET